MSDLGEIVEAFTRVVSRPPTALILLPQLQAIGYAVARSTGASVAVSTAGDSVSIVFSGRNATAAAALARRQVLAGTGGIHETIVDVLAEELP